MADPVSYTKTFSNVHKGNIREVFATETPVPPEVAAALDFVYEIVQQAGPSSGAITYHEGGQLVVLVYPGKPDAV